MRELITDPASMEPMLPSEGERQLEDLAFSLIRKASSLAGQLHPTVSSALGSLVRSMNCYYSNLIEGHDTHPFDIDRALHHDYASEPKRRALQLEAVAHIEVQDSIDNGRDDSAYPASSAYAAWLHREFCVRLPEELLWIDDPFSSRLCICSLEFCGTAKWSSENIIHLLLPHSAFFSSASTRLTIRRICRR
jgi:hypothetical protein